MKKKDKKKFFLAVWLLTDAIILVCSILAIMQGGTANTAVGIFGLLLLVVEVILFKKGYII